MTSHARTPFWLAATMLSTALATATTAQTAPSAATAADALADTSAQLLVADIIVTAERRSQPQQTVPAAVTALTDDQLELRGIVSTLQLAQIVPNMVALTTPGLGGTTAWYIRGLGSADPLPLGNTPVGMFVDDVHVSPQVAGDVALFDLDRVEVLRGPQNTLFGNNTTGGVVAVMLEQPAEKFGGFAELGYGSDHQWLGRASLDVPLGDAFALKLSGYYRNGNGTAYDSLTGEQLNQADASGIRGALRVALGDHFSWNAALAYMYNNSTNLPSFACDPANPTDCSGRFSTTGLLQDWPNGGTYNPYAPATVSGAKAQFALGTVTKTTLLTSNLQWAGDAATLNLITGVVDTSQDSAIDFADGRGLPSALVPEPAVHGYPSGGYTLVNQGQYDGFSQEVKLSGKLLGDRVGYVVGALFTRQDNSSDIADVFNFGPVLGIADPAGAPAVLADRQIDTTTNSSAVYGQVDLHATAKLTLTGGLRWTDQSLTLGARDNRSGCAGACIDTAALAAAGIPTEMSNQHFSPKFVASWQQDANLLFYASATNGGGSGGWNSRATSADALLPYAAENVWSYEVGIKSQWFDNRLRANLTGFYLDVTDLAVSSTSVSSLGLPVATTRSTGLRNQGIELEIAATPIDRLSVFASAGYQNARYVVDSGAPDIDAYGVASVSFQQAQCRAQLAAGKIPLGAGASAAPACAAGIVDANGNIAQPVRTPDLTFALGASYQFPIPTAGIVLSPSVNLVYTSSMETDSANATLWSGSVTSAYDGQVYPANPFGGDFIAGSHTGAVTQVNAQLALTTDDSHWLVAIACTNCFNTTTSQASLYSYNYANPPVMWSIRAKRTF